MAEERSVQERLEHLLGELELAIMQIVWARDEVTVRQVWSALQPQRPLAYTTVMTVMSRLAQKGVLVVRKQGKTYYYRAAATADEFVSQRAQRAVENVLANFGDVAVAHFLRNLERVDPERLAALQTLIEEERSDAT
jgi:predicted transcriptional regulator